MGQRPFSRRRLAAPGDTGRASRAPGTFQWQVRRLRLSPEALGSRRVLTRGVVANADLATLDDDFRQWSQFRQREIASLSR
jgi:hypothetical protein